MTYLILKTYRSIKIFLGKIFSLSLVAFIFLIIFDKRSYTVLDLFLEARDRNLFIKAVYNTAYYVLLSVPITIALALVIALLLNSNIKFRAFFRTAYFIPFVTSAVAISLVWRWIFDDAYGLLNYMLSF